MAAQEPLSAYISRTFTNFNTPTESHVTNLHWDRIQDGAIKHQHIRVSNSQKINVVEKAIHIIGNYGADLAYNGRKLIDCSLHDHSPKNLNDLCILWLDIELDYDKITEEFTNTSKCAAYSAPWNDKPHATLESEIRIAVCSIVSELAKLKKHQYQSIWWQAHSNTARSDDISLDGTRIRRGKFSLHAYWPEIIIRREWLPAIVEWIRDQLIAQSSCSDPLVDSLSMRYWWSKSIDVKAADTGYLRMPLFPKFQKWEQDYDEVTGAALHNPFSPGQWVRPIMPCSTYPLIEVAAGSIFICDNMFDATGEKRAKLPTGWDLLKSVVSCFMSSTQSEPVFKMIEGKKTLLCESFVKAWRIRRNLLMAPIVSNNTLPDAEEEKNEEERIKRDPLASGCFDWRRKNIRWNDDVFAAMEILLTKAKAEVARNIKSEALALAPLYRYIDRRAVHVQPNSKVWVKIWNASMNKWELNKQFTTKGFTDVWATTLAWETWNGKKWISVPILKKWLERAPNCVGSVLEPCSFEERDEIPFHLERTRLLNEFTALDAWQRYDRLVLKPTRSEYIKWADRFVYHLRYCLCRGDATAAWNCLMIIANTVIHPNDPIEVVTSFQGNEGTGKSRFMGWIFTYIFGLQHGAIVSNPQRDITGTFNSVIGTALFLLMEEGHIGKDRQYASQLQHLVTGKNQMVNEKHQPLKQVRNKHAIFACNNCKDISTGTGSSDGRRWFINLTDNLITNAPENSPFKSEFFELLNELCGKENKPNEEALNAIVTWLIQDKDIRCHLKTYRRKVRFSGAMHTMGSINQRIHIEKYTDSVRYWVILAAKRGAFQWPKQQYVNSKIETEEWWPSPTKPHKQITVHPTELYKSYITSSGRKQAVNDIEFRDKFLSYTGLTLDDNGCVVFQEGSLAAVRTNLESTIPGLRLSDIYNESYQHKNMMDTWNEVKEKGSIWKSEKFLERFPKPDIENNPGKEVDDVIQAGEDHLKKANISLLTEDDTSIISNPVTPPNPNVMNTSSTDSHSPPSPEFIPDPQFPDIGVEQINLPNLPPSPNSSPVKKKVRRPIETSEDKEKLFNEQYGNESPDESDEGEETGDNLTYF